MSTTSPRRRFKLYPSFYGWWIVAVSFTALFIHGASTSYLFGLMVVPMEEDLGWSRTTLIGALTVATFVTAGLGLILGPLFDRHGARVGMTLSALLGGTCLILLAFVNTPWQYYLLLGLGAGVARTGLENIGPRTAISNWFVRRRAAAFAWFSGGRAVFGFAMVPIFGWLIERTTWRAGWGTLGVVELVVLVPLCWFVIRRRPEDYGLRPDGDPYQPAATTSGKGPIGAPPDEDHWTRREAMRTKALWLIVAGYVLTGFPAAGLIANMVPYFRDQGMSPHLASWAFAFFGFGALFGRPTWGFIAGRFGVHLGLTLYGLGYGLSIAFYTFASTDTALFIAAWPLGLTTGGAAQLQAQAWPDYFGRRHVGAITGSTILIITPAMAAGPLVAAAVYDILGSYIQIFSIYAGAAFFAGVLFFLAKPPVRPSVHGDDE